MNKFEEFMSSCAEHNDKFVDLLKNFEASLIQRDQELLQCIQNDIDQFHLNGVITPSFENGAEVPVETPASKQPGRAKQRANSRAPSGSDSSKENEPEANRRLRPTTGRPQRSVFKDTTPVANEQATHQANTTSKELYIKLEKVSDEFANKISELADPSMTVKKLKKEAMEMPPPPKPAPRNGRKTRGKKSSKVSTYVNGESVQVKLELIDEERKKGPAISKLPATTQESDHRRDSDVQIQTDIIDTVILNDTIEEPEKLSRAKGRTKNKRKLESKPKSNTDDESEGENKKMRREELPVPLEQTTRVTRTKTRAATKNKEAEKQPTSESSAEEEKEKVVVHKTRTKKAKAKELPEDSMPTDKDDKAVAKGTSNSKKNEKPNKILNETVVIHKPALLNETVTLEKPAPLLSVTTTISVASDAKMQDNEQALMTDDEDLMDSAHVAKKLKKSNPVISPYEERAVKKRVQAFERLCAGTTPDKPSKIPSVINKAVPKVLQKINNENALVNGNEALNHPYMSPPKTQLISKTITRTNSSSTVNSTFMSEIKASHSETRLRNLRQKQREAEISRKQESIIQAMAEERRRRREEKQLRAQQARDAMEREKQKALDSAARAKEEKLKKVLSEKEDKLQKQREQAAQKRAQAIKKATEEKLKECKKKEEQKSSEKRPRAKIVPPYLKYATPLLPTADCYDSDDENSKKPHYIRSWEKKPVLLAALQHQYFGYHLKKYLFYCGPQTPDLTEIFPTIEPYKLKRTSSAVWDRTAMSKLDTLSEED